MNLCFNIIMIEAAAVHGIPYVIAEMCLYIDVPSIVVLEFLYLTGL